MDGKCECEPCHACNGRGRFYFDRMGLGMEQDEPCWNCLGYGVEEICDYCEAMGYEP